MGANGQAKQPYCFEVNDGELFALAGLWENWKDPSGQWIKSCSILATTPNAVTSAVHDRMPVILDRDDYDLWLDPGTRNADAMSELLKPYDAHAMRSYPVTNRVNHWSWRLAAFIIRRPGRIALGVVPFCRRDSGDVEVLGVLQLNVCAKRFIEHFAGLLLSTRSIGHGLFYADGLMTFRALAGAMTGAVHFVPWPKPTDIGQFWLFHAPSFPQAGQFGHPLDIQTEPLTHARTKTVRIPD